MKTFLTKQVVRARIWADERGQDMVEYALLAGFIAIVVGASFPPINDQLSTIFSKLSSTAEKAAN